MLSDARNATDYTSARQERDWKKHRHDCKSRPKNTELSSHFEKNHDPEKDVEIHILQTGLTKVEERDHYEDRWICLLQTLQPCGINKDVHAYAASMYKSLKDSICRWSSLSSHQVSSAPWQWAEVDDVNPSAWPIWRQLILCYNVFRSYKFCIFQISSNILSTVRKRALKMAK